MCRLVGSRGGGGEGRVEKGRRAREEKRLSPLIPTIPPSPRTRLSYETKRATDPRRGGDGDGDAPDGKKRAGALLPAHERTKETIVEYEVEYKLSSGDRARNQSTSCPALLLPLPPPPSAFSLFSRLSSSLFQTLPDVTRRSDEVIVQRYEKNLVEFRFAVTNASC